LAARAAQRDARGHEDRTLTDRITIEIGASLRRDLEQLAAAEDRPLAYVARRAIARDVAERSRREQERPA
jgi:predicted transcriptional regulator